METWAFGRNLRLRTGGAYSFLNCKDSGNGARMTGIEVGFVGHPTCCESAWISLVSPAKSNIFKPQHEVKNPGRLNYMDVPCGTNPN